MSSDANACRRSYGRAPSMPTRLAVGLYTRLRQFPDGVIDRRARRRVLHHDRHRRQLRTLRRLQHFRGARTRRVACAYDEDLDDLFTEAPTEQRAAERPSAEGPQAARASAFGPACGLLRDGRPSRSAPAGELLV